MRATLLAELLPDGEADELIPKEVESPPSAGRDRERPRRYGYAAAGSFGRQAVR